jgi:hypothetical protein
MISKKKIFEFIFIWVSIHGEQKERIEKNIIDFIHQSWNQSKSIEHKSGDREKTQRIVLQR